MQNKIGFIGLGIMGEPMAHNLLSGEYELTVYNRTAGRGAGLKQAGAEAAVTPLLVGRAAEIVILMLTGPEAIDAVVWGEKGVLGEDSKCRTIVNMSTVSPAYTRRLAEKLDEKGITLIDAPVSGSKKPAEDATLVILAGGPKEVVEELKPMLLKMGKKVVYCGNAGDGSSMKMFVNLLLCSMISSLSESLTLGEKCGLSKDAMLETVLAGPLGCGLFSMKADMFKSNEYPVQFPFKHMFKDLNFILDTARDTGMKTGVGETLQKIYAEGMKKGFGELDFAAVKKVYES